MAAVEDLLQKGDEVVAEADAEEESPVEAKASVDQSGDQNATGPVDAKNETMDPNEDRHAARKEARAKRQAKMAQLMSEQIGDSYENPDDIAEIQHAQDTMGYFNLKTDEKYVVPEDQRVNADKKKREMVLLETSVYKIKMGFNERFLALRELKSKIIEGVQDDAVRMKAINEELSDLELEGTLPTFEEDPSEFPERRMEAADGASATETAGGDPAEEAEAAAAADDDDDDEEDFVPEMSEVEAAEHEAHRRRLQHERVSMLERVDQTVGAFDEALQALRRERFTLTADLKTTELKMLLLSQELALLKEFELREVKLMDRLAKKQQEKADILVSIEDCQEKLAVSKTQVEDLLKTDKQIQKELQQLCGDSQFWEQLQKTFKRKIKRVKPKELTDGGSDEETESESESDWDSDEEEEEEEDVCPQGCAQDLFDKVCALRERRLDQEELNAEVQKDVTQLKKENDGFLKREKTCTTALGKIEEDIQVSLLLEMGPYKPHAFVSRAEIPIREARKAERVGCGGDTEAPPDPVPQQGASPFHSRCVGTRVSHGVSDGRGHCRFLRRPLRRRRRRRSRMPW